MKAWYRFRLETEAETGRSYHCSECGHNGPVGYVSRSPEGKALKIVCSPQCRDAVEYRVFSERAEARGARRVKWAKAYLSSKGGTKIT